MKSIKLTKLAENQLSEKEMNAVTGGTDLPNGWSINYTVRPIPGTYDIQAWCGCGCFYANAGGSSTDGNLSANDAGHLWSRPR